jgi:hypothetical protein
MYPCKGREDHCHGPKHLRLLLWNANILDSLKCFIVFNFNVVEKEGTLKSCKQTEDHCHGPKHRRHLSNANFLHSLKFLIVLNFNVVEKNGTLINSSLPCSPILIWIEYVCFFFNMVTLLKMKIELALSFVNLEIVTIQRLEPTLSFGSCPQVLSWSKHSEYHHPSYNP